MIIFVILRLLADCITLYAGLNVCSSIIVHDHTKQNTLTTVQKFMISS